MICQTFLKTSNLKNQIDAGGNMILQDQSFPTQYIYNTVFFQVDSHRFSNS